MLAKEGAIPVIVGRNREDNHKTATIVTSEGGRTFEVVAELSDSTCADASGGGSLLRNYSPVGEKRE